MPTAIESIATTSTAIEPKAITPKAITPTKKQAKFAYLTEVEDINPHRAAQLAGYSPLTANVACRDIQGKTGTKLAVQALEEQTQGADFTLEEIVPKIRNLIEEGDGRTRGAVSLKLYEILKKGSPNSRQQAITATEHEQEQLFTKHRASDAVVNRMPIIERCPSCGCSLKGDDAKGKRGRGAPP